VAAEEGAGDLRHRGLARGAAAAGQAGVQPAALRRHDAGPRPALCRRLPDRQGAQGRLLVRLRRARLAAAGAGNPDGGRSDDLAHRRQPRGRAGRGRQCAGAAHPAAEPPRGPWRCRAGARRHALAHRLAHRAGPATRGCHGRAGGLAAGRRSGAPLPPRPPDPQLLQGLPDVPPPDRADAGDATLPAPPPSSMPSERDALLGEALAILAEPSLEALFAPGSLAEVPLAAVLGEGERASASPARSTGWRSAMTRCDRRLQDQPAAAGHARKRPIRSTSASLPPIAPHSPGSIPAAPSAASWCGRTARASWKSPPACSTPPCGSMGAGLRRAPGLAA
jgi:hypothetical protein